ncbi:MAG TPA: hypothetical protein VJ851_16030 [Jatrophihabitans sp.]|nr:hypothetical protein [Jatrophihabitans sp.]
MDASKVQVFGEVAEILDARRLELHKADGDPSAARAAFVDRQGSYLIGREAFEQLWVDGDQFVYGALNAGGLGTQGRYGPFCLVIGRPTERGRPVALFPGDSAQRYNVAAGLDSDSARSEATAWDDRDSLAVVERHAEALANYEAEWPAVICRPGSYLEAVMGPPLPIEDVVEVRLPRPYLDRLAELQTGELDGEVLSRSEREEVLAFTELQNWRAVRGTDVIGIP